LSPEASDVKIEGAAMEIGKSGKFALLASIVLLTLLMMLQTSICRGDEGCDLPKFLRAGFLAKVYADIDPRDAQAALQLLTRELSRRMGLGTSPKVIVFPDTRAMIDAVRQGELDMLSMPGIDYLSVRDKVSLIPSLVGAHNNGMGTRYVLISRNDTGIKSIADLKGKTLYMPSASKQKAGHVWLDVLLMREGKRSPGAFFRNVKEAGKVSQAIMGVFFRQADGAVVTRAGLDASRALNPQLERQLVVLAESRDLIDGITCFPANVSEKTRRILMNATAEINNSTTGRQLFTIFQTSGAIPFRPVCLEGLEDLLREQKRLKTKTAKRR
jgi:ABC-type phosphate/phosphonate transport system substrate-binding protein